MNNFRTVWNANDLRRKITQNWEMTSYNYRVHNLNGIDLMIKGFFFWPNNLFRLFLFLFD